MIENTDRATNLYHASLPTKYSTVMSEAGRQRGGGVCPFRFWPCPYCSPTPQIFGTHVTTSTNWTYMTECK